MLCLLSWNAAKNEANQLREEAALPIEQLLERYGGAGLLLNRAIASMKKGTSSGKVLSPVIRAKPDLTPDDDDGENSEPQSDKSESKSEGAESCAAEIDSAGTESCVSEKDKLCVNLADSISNGFCKEDGDDMNTNNDSSFGVNTADVAAASSRKRENGNTSTAAGCGGDSGKTESESNSELVESCASGSASCDEAGGSHADAEPGSSSSTSEVYSRKPGLPPISVWHIYHKNIKLLACI